MADGEGTTHCKACGREIEQVGGGHRRREYCDDACKHVAQRRRQEDRRKEEMRERWAPFTSETQVYLDLMMSRYGEDLANGIAIVLAREVVDQGRVAGQQKIAELEQEIEHLREKQVSRVEKLKARITELEQEKEEAQRSPIEEQNIRQVEKYAIDAALAATEAKERIEGLEQELALSQQNVAAYQEKLAQTGSHIQKLERQVEVQRERLGQSYQQQPNQTQRVAELEQELAQANQGLDAVQERFRQYVHMTNEKLGELSGELAKLRQEKERKPNAANLKELEQARDDLLRLYQERARAGEEIHQLSELAQELRMKLRAAHNRITELEQSDLRTSHLEQELSRYRQLCDLDNRQQMETQAMALGAQVGYKPLITTVPPVQAGEEIWHMRIQQANTEDLMQIIATAKH